MKLKHKLIYLLRTNSVKKLWHYAAKGIIFLGGVRLAAYLTYLGIDWGKIDSQNPTVLCISRDYFSKDITELRARTNINYPCILGGYVRFQQNWFPFAMQNQTFYQSYTGEGREKAIEKSIEYASQILEKANKVQKIDAVMSANFDYWQDVGFKYVCKKLNIPFLVLSREHITIPMSFDSVTKWYIESNYEFQGTAIAVGGETTAKIFEKCPNLRQSKVWVTGLPRLDMWKEIDTNIPLNQRPYLTLLTYTDGYYADENFREVVKLFSTESLKYNNDSLQFIVKCKNYDDYIIVLDILSGHDISKLKFVYDMPLYELLPQSRLVINYNSLSIVEAVISKAKVAIPDWGDCRKEENQAMCSPNDPLINRAVSFMKSADEFNAIIKKAIDGEDQLLPADIVHEFVNKYFYMPEEGTISQKVEEFIRFHLNSQVGN